MKAMQEHKSNIRFSYTVEQLKKELTAEIERSKDRAKKYENQLPELKAASEAPRPPAETDKYHQACNKYQAVQRLFAFCEDRVAFLTYYLEHLSAGEWHDSVVSIELTLEDVGTLGLVKHPSPHLTLAMEEVLDEDEEVE